jgi:hypothetical protein
MLGAGLRLVTSLALSGAEVAVDAGRVVLGDDFVDIRPRQFRRILLTFEDSIQGRIPEILGDDEEERVETLVRLLRGTSEKELTLLISDLQLALTRLYEEDRRTERSADRRLRGNDDRRRTGVPRPA